MAYEEWNAKVIDVIDEAHQDNLGGEHREGFCKACSDALLVAQRAVPGGPDVETNERLRRDTIKTFTGDSMHPDWADYVATNLLHALKNAKNSGDWYNVVLSWCERWSTGRMPPNAQS